MTLPLSHYYAVQAEYPRWPGELLSHYLERLTLLAGGKERADADFVGKDEDIKAGHVRVTQEWREADWMPYRED